MAGVLHTSYILSGFFFGYFFVVFFCFVFRQKGESYLFYSLAKNKGPYLAVFKSSVYNDLCPSHRVGYVSMPHIKIAMSEFHVPFREMRCSFFSVRFFKVY